MFPRAIILQTEEPVKALRALPANCPPEMWRHFITVILEHVVDCHRDSHTVGACVSRLMDDLNKGRYHSYYSQSTQLTMAVANVSDCVLREIIANRIYDPDGVMRYYYYPVNDPNFNDVLLIREPALPAP